MSRSIRSNAATGYSAKVDLSLIIGQRSLELGQIAPDSVWLREPIDLPPCDATILMTVDGREQRWEVYLPDGLSANSRNARTCDRQSVTTSER